LLSTVGYVDLRTKQEAQLCDLIVSKLAQYDNTYLAPIRHIRLRKTDRRPDSMAVLSERFGPPDSNPLRVGVNPFLYPTFNQLLDDLFIEYLSDRVEPFTYGSRWILINQSGVILAPPLWVSDTSRAIGHTSASWLISAIPSELGIIPGSSWDIEIAARNAAGIRWRAAPFVLAFTTEEAMTIALRHEKALYLMKREGVFKETTLTELERGKYVRVLVISNHVAGPRGGLVLAQVTPSIPPIVLDFYGGDPST
jgi:hypothetical protein